MSMLLVPPPVAGHEPAGTPDPACETPAGWLTHEYGAPATGVGLSDATDGNRQDCDGDFDPTDPFCWAEEGLREDFNGDGTTCEGLDHDGHSEFAQGGAWLLVDSGDGATGGSVLCFGEVGHHPAFGPVAVEDAALGSAVPFRVAADTIDETGMGDPCGDFISDVGTDCVGTCSLTFPAGLDGSYQVYAGDVRTGVVGTAGHVSTPACGDDCAASDPLCDQGVCEPVPDVLPPLEDPLQPSPPCKRPWTVTLMADEPDLFSSPAAASPSQDMQDWIASLNRPLRGFDQGGSNRHFAHTFTGLGGYVVGAQMVIRLRATTDIPSNDGLGLQFDYANNVPSFAWSTGIAAEAAAQNNQPWPGTVTLGFNLGVAPHDLRDSIGVTGKLDVYVQDDTLVDYIQLHLVYCPCDQVSALVQQGTTTDNFVGPEPTTPRTGLPTGPRVYDDGGHDEAFSTTLYLPDLHCLKEGFVEIRTRVENSLVSTDWISIQRKGNNWMQGQAAPVGPVGSTAVTQIPLTSAVLQDMALNGYFDIYVQDDSAVDYVRLVLTYSP